MRVNSSYVLLAALGATPTFAGPGQPTATGTTGQFQITGNSLVSAQQVLFAYPWLSSNTGLTSCFCSKVFLGTPNKVYIIDKVENNPHSINGHPAWASGT